MTYTYNNRFAAHCVFVDGAREIVTVPDQVGEDQNHYNDEQIVFPALLRGRSIEVRVDGDATGLGTTGTGDLVVTAVDTPL